MIRMGSFRSYVGLEDYEMKIPKPVDAIFLQPDFVEGEIIVAEADNVLRFTSISKKKGLSGSLFVTNARLIFVSSDSTEYAVPLLSVNTICYYEETKGSGGRKTKRKVKLGLHALDSTPGSSASSTLFSSASTRVHELLVTCSNFRNLRVSFKFSLVDHGQKICNALIHWSSPQQLEKLFFLDYCRAIETRFKNSLPLYNIPGDWLREIKISRTLGFRISLANINFDVCESLQETIVVPADVTDVRLISLSGKLKGSRPPFWVWGNVNGSAILRMGQLHNESDSAAENQFFETLRKAHPQKRPPHIYDLDIIFPVKDIRHSMTRLFDLCCPESLSHYDDADSKFLTHLENTKWLSWTSKVLQVSLEIAESIVYYNDVVILQENESRDTSCLIGSVAQIMLDSRFRTIAGFFSLIQKDWISTGHPFHSNYMHTSPIFLLYLDSVYQLLHQNPFEFEFNETLLSEIWDSCFDPTTGTFLFDTPSQRKSLELRKDLNVWQKIMSKQDILIEATEVSFVNQRVSKFHPVDSIQKSLLNPLYQLKSLLCPPVTAAFKNNGSPLLSCFFSIAQIRLWNSLYLDRTAELVDIGAGVSRFSLSPTPHVKSTSNLSAWTPSPRGSSGSTTSTNSSPSPSHGSAFPFSNKESPAISSAGRNFVTEQKLVDLLLVASSTTTKYRKSLAVTNSSRATGQSNLNSFPITPRRLGKAESSSSRKNPFLDS